MEQVKLIHDIDLDKKKRKKKRERQEEKLKKMAPPAKKSRVPLDTMLGLEKEDVPLENEETKSNSKQKFEFHIVNNTIDEEHKYELIIENKLSKKAERINDNFRKPANFFGVPNSVYINYPRIENELQKLEESFYHIFEQAFYLGPLRDYPRRLYSWAGDRPEGVGDRLHRSV